MKSDVSGENFEYRGAGGLEQALANGGALLASDPRLAAAQAREILRVNPVEARAFRLLGHALRAMGEDQGAEQAELEAIQCSSHNPTLVNAAVAIMENRLNDAEHLLRPHLADISDDAAALGMLAEIGIRTGAYPAAEDLLRSALAIAPTFASARLRLARVLSLQNRPSESLVVLDSLIQIDPDNNAARGSKAAALGRVGDYGAAIALYEGLLARDAEKPGIWTSYGHILNTVGRLEDSIHAYRNAIGLDPTFGDAWWGLANLKTVRLDEQDVAAMLAALEREGVDPNSRLHLHFALGKAFEDQGRAEPSFQHYAAGNAARRSTTFYGQQATTDFVDQSIAQFTPAFFRERAGYGDPHPDPIFVIGMPRAGSTLIEQILSSHPAIEGTSELAYVPSLTRRLERNRPDGASYPDMVAELDEFEARELGGEYLDSAASHRKSDKPRFIDKLPNNWMNIGFIHTVLPNAKIIDARRHPLDCCFSNFKQNFARGQAFSYSLEDLGHYYSDYVRLLAHFDEVLPAKVHRVIHEQLIADPEGEVRRMLDYLGVGFEEQCLRFYQSDRAVRTPSAEQVRRPINRDGVDRWKAYDPWLGPLKQSLGPVLACYPEIPTRWS